MGKRDIALHLLALGARMDIFAAAMSAGLTWWPPCWPRSRRPPARRRPHGISLMSHAKKGGKEAAAVVKLLQGLAEQP